MGHVCSCHRRQKFDKGTRWKSDQSLLSRLGLRCSGRHTFNSDLPLTMPSYFTTTTSSAAVQTSRTDPEIDKDEQKKLVDDAIVCSTVPHCSSSPSSPSPMRAAPPPKPPRMRSMIVTCDNENFETLQPTATSASTCNFQTINEQVTGSEVNSHHVTIKQSNQQQYSSNSMTSSKLFYSRTASVMTSCASELLIVSGLQPEVIVDFLRRRDVINEETMAAVYRCATKRTACELIVEVVVSKGRNEFAVFTDAIRTAGNEHIANCLETVDNLLTLKSAVIYGVADCTGKSLSSAFRCVCQPNTSDKLCCHGNAQFDVDIVYTDPTSGLLVENDVIRSSANDVISAVRANCLRHRSVFLDPETMSLPTYFQSLACNDVTGHRSHNGEVNPGVPMISLSVTNVCLTDKLADEIVEVTLQYPCVGVFNLVKCHRLHSFLVQFQRSVTNRKLKNGGASNRLTACYVNTLNIRLCRDLVAGNDVISTDQRLVSDLSSYVSRSLRSLSLSGSGLTSVCCSLLFRHLVTGSRHLVELDIGFNDVTDTRPIGDALAGNCSLRRLRMRSNAISTDAVVLIFKSLRRNYRLEYFDISGNTFGSTTFRRLTPSLDNHTQLRSPVALSLAELLISNRTLSHLYMERCGLGVDECNGLGRGLLTNSSLTTLDVSGNPLIGDEGLSVIMTSLRCNERSVVNTLSANMCTISDQGLYTLLDSISTDKHRTTKLNVIKLCYNCITTSSIQPRNRKQRQTLMTSSTTIGVTSSWTGSNEVEDISKLTTVNNSVNNNNNRQEIGSDDVITSKASRPRSFARGQQQSNSQRQLQFNACNNTALLRSASDVIGRNEIKSSSVDIKHHSVSVCDTRTTDHRLQHQLSGITSNTTDISTRDIYRMLCDVLAVNPGLKILLWGNSVTTSGGSKRKDFADVHEEDIESSEVANNNIDTRQHHSAISNNTQRMSTTLTAERRRELIAASPDMDDDWNVEAIYRKYSTLPTRYRQQNCKDVGTDINK